jgi:hypothetical protein
MSDVAPYLLRKTLMWPSHRVGMGFLNKSLCDGCPWNIPEFRRGVVPSFRCHDVDVIAASSGHLAGFLERRLRGFPAVHKFAVLAHGFDRETHFLFFFLFLLMTLACALNASASDFIWLATNASAVWVATRSAVIACFLMAFCIPMTGLISRKWRCSEKEAQNPNGLRVSWFVLFWAV